MAGTDNLKASRNPNLAHNRRKFSKDFKSNLKLELKKKTELTHLLILTDENKICVIMLLSEQKFSVIF